MKGPAFWSARSPREQRVIAIMGGGLALLLVVTFVWLPLERARTRMLAELPALRASIATLERQASEVKRLRAMPAASNASAAPLNAIATTNPLPGAQLAALDARRVRVTGTDLSYGALLDWLASVQASHGLRVEAARLDALPAAGRVRAELTLSRS
jgi:type II secretory pathway component PulM